MKTKKIDVNGISLAYTRGGVGKPLMLVHGFPFDHRAWDSVVSLLEGEYDLLLPDLRGFGESTTVDTQYHIADMADDLAALLDYLGIEKIAIAGHSMGGYVALAFATKHPQAAADTSERKEGRYKTAQDVDEKGVEVVAEAMTPKLTERADAQAVVKDLILRQGKAGVIGALKAMAEREDSMPTLSSFTFPVVLAHGDADALIPIEKSQEIKEALPSAQLVVLEGAGHMPMLEFPNETAEALKLLK
ncbi:MAG TPA: alpha/beta hydrolase [Anaerolineales bacterium]|nr:alpha/beta hydrolase [Anaerolineales bacterium]